MDLQHTNVAATLDSLLLSILNNTAVHCKFMLIIKSLNNNDKKVLLESLNKVKNLIEGELHE